VANISYSNAAIRDLEQIGDYIAERLKGPGAALNTVNKIQNRIDTLGDFPLIGAHLSSIYEIATDYRFLVCGNYLVFYRPQNNNNDDVLIDRILYGRRDYLAILFGDLPQDETE
jgi:plasmid stabilization system protein ParE